MEILEEDQALLEYFVGDSSIFIFRIEKDYYEVKEVKRDFPLEEWVQQLRDNISQPLPFAYEAYLEVAPKLYEKLIAPVAEGLPEKLVIVPDGILGYIPFEALLTGKPDVNNLYAAERLPYLLREHQVSYCYSATLLKEMKEKKHRKAPTRELLAVAPFATVDTVLSSHLGQSDWLASTRSDTLWGLPYTQAELDSIQRVFETDAFYGAEATEASFVERAGDYRILHLSTHGKADPRVGDYSYLAFYPQPDSLENELLYVRDLYNLQLNADLVVLSACETGTGELQQGEGIISLARAFAYAGAKSIATTLWQVNDQSTQELMARFYQHLKSGMTKDAALRQAKLDYLDGHNDTGAYPFYWAAFIGVGDMGRL
jgi:CHAT domain-containing protein